MNAEQLRESQAPLKARYREAPESAHVTLRVVGLIEPGRQACTIEAGHGPRVEAGLHPATGGDGLSACSGDMLLASLAACAGVTLGAVATALGIAVRGGSVVAEGDLDFRGTLGVSKEVPVGFTDIRLTFSLDSDAGDEPLANLLRLTERYCVIYQTLRSAPGVTTRIERSSS